MFDQLKQRLKDVMDQATTPAEGRAAVSLMREAVVEAKVAVREMHSQLDATRSRLAREREELETVKRRGRLAAQIEDTETMTVAQEYERRHGERVAVLERKLASQEEEIALAMREVEEMTRELKRRAAGIEPGRRQAEGIGSEGTAPGEAAQPSSAAGADPLESAPGLSGQMDRMAREARASEMLAELKRRMGK